MQHCREGRGSRCSDTDHHDGYVDDVTGRDSTIAVCRDGSSGGFREVNSYTSADRGNEAVCALAVSTVKPWV